MYIFTTTKAIVHLETVLTNMLANGYRFRPRVSYNTFPCTFGTAKGRSINDVNTLHYNGNVLKVLIKTVLFVCYPVITLWGYCDPQWV